MSGPDRTHLSGDEQPDGIQPSGGDSFQPGQPFSSWSIDDYDNYVGELSSWALRALDGEDNPSPSFQSWRDSNYDGMLLDAPVPPTLSSEEQTRPAPKGYDSRWNTYALHVPHAFGLPLRKLAPYPQPADPADGTLPTLSSEEQRRPAFATLLSEEQSRPASATASSSYFPIPQQQTGCTPAAVSNLASSATASSSGGGVPPSAHDNFGAIYVPHADHDNVGTFDVPHAANVPLNTPTPGYYPYAANDAFRIYRDARGQLVDRPPANVEPVTRLRHPWGSPNNDDIFPRQHRHTFRGGPSLHHDWVRGNWVYYKGGIRGFEPDPIPTWYTPNSTSQTGYHAPQ